MTYYLILTYLGWSVEQPARYATKAEAEAQGAALVKRYGPVKAQYTVQAEGGR